MQEIVKVLSEILEAHQQEYTSSCGPEDYCDCGVRLGHVPIYEHQALVLFDAGWRPSGVVAEP